MDAAANQDPGLIRGTGLGDSPVPLSAVLDEPYSLIGVQTIAADTDEEALELARPIALSMIRLRRGDPGPMPTPKEAAEYPYTEQESSCHRQLAVRRGLRSSPPRPSELASTSCGNAPR